AEFGNAVASFTALSLDKPANGYTLQATSSGLPAVTSNPFNVTAAPATQLVITTQPPGSVTAGASFGLVVTAEERFGNPATSLAGSVAIALANNAGNTTLGAASPSGGSDVAVFTGLTLNRAASGYTLIVTSHGLASASSTAINVAPAAVSQL